MSDDDKVCARALNPSHTGETRMTTQDEQLPAYEVSDAEIRLVRDLHRAGAIDLASGLFDLFMEKRWAGCPRPRRASESRPPVGLPAR
jgi:hypothetical protein